jgi:hypothetical protein
MLLGSRDRVVGRHFREEPPLPVRQRRGGEDTVRVEPQA